MHKLSLLLVLVVAASLAATACGGSATPTPTATPDPTPTPTPESPGPASFDEVGFASLLTREEVAAVLPDFDVADSNFVDFGAMAAGVDPAQMIGIDSFTGLTFQNANAGVTFAVIDFVSSERALEHLAVVSAAYGALEEISPTIGDSSFQGSGDGVSSVTFFKGELAVAINAAGLPTTGAEMEALLSIARLIESRL